jgi:glucose-6-phosphate 1-dehydrogenase
VKVLKSVRPISKHQVHAHAFRAQYAPGKVGDRHVGGYVDEQGIPADSTTETFAAIKLYIDNWRWRNVPIYLRTGKRMAEKRSMISIRFKHPPQQLFHETLTQPIPANWLLLGIQPEQAIRCELQIRESGIGMHTSTTQLDASTCENCQQHEAYEGLLLDAMAGDHTQYLRSDEVHRAWHIVDPIQKVWASERSFIHTYPSGSWGPAEASRLFDRDDQTWRVSLDPDAATIAR